MNPTLDARVSLLVAHEWHNRLLSVRRIRAEAWPGIIDSRCEHCFKATKCSKPDATRALLGKRNARGRYVTRGIIQIMHSRRRYLADGIGREFIEHEARALTS